MTAYRNRTKRKREIHRNLQEGLFFCASWFQWFSPIAAIVSGGIEVICIALFQLVYLPQFKSEQNIRCSGQVYTLPNMLEPSFFTHLRKPRVHINNCCYVRLKPQCSRRQGSKSTRTERNRTLIDELNFENNICCIFHQY